MARVLITGGTGSLGQVLVRKLLKGGGYERIRILSRGEHKQSEMKEKFPGPIDWVIGDVRDRERVIEACRGVTDVFHLAAFKSIDLAAYNPLEAVKTNIIGTSNVISACKINGVEKAMFTSTDKATSPTSIYGATKLCAEKIWIQGNIGDYPTRFSAVRYGNQVGSNGSVFLKWKGKREVSVTHPEMTRFFISIPQATDFILDCFNRMTGAEVFIPKMRSIDIGTVARWFAEMYRVTGIRSGEKMHEALFSEDEARYVTDLGDRFILWPTHNLYPVKVDGDELDREEAYTSYNAQRLSKEDLEAML